MDFLMNRIMPVLVKVGNNNYLVAIRDGITKTIPFTIVGSIFLIIANFPVSAWTDFIAPWSGMLSAVSNVTFSALGLITAIGVGYYMGETFELDAISTSLLTTIAFLLATLTDDFTINAAAFDSTGMFTAIVMALLTNAVFRFCLKRNFVIKMPEGVPPNVSTSFTALIPGAIVLVIVWVLRAVLGINLNEVISTVFSPLVMGLNTLPGMMLYSFMVCLLWVCGIHGDNVLSGIASPIFLGLLAENVAAMQAGTVPPNFISDGYWIVFMCFGGTGSTLGLVLNMLRSRSKMYRDLGKMSLPAAIFCINEPVIFGFPIVMNPMMMIPFIVTPLVLCAGTYLLMTIGVVGRICIQVPWTIPPVIGAYLATNGSVGAAIWAAVEIVISYVIYRPFFKAEEKKQVEQELAAAGETTAA